MQDILIHTTAPESGTDKQQKAAENAVSGTMFPVIAGSPAGFKAHLKKEWGWIALRGAAGILFGLMAIIWPLATIWALAIMWGIFALVDGASALMGGWDMHKQGSRWWPYLIFGLIGLAAGVLTLMWPAITAFVLVYVIAFWALFGGATQIAAAIRLRKEIQGEWLLALVGFIGILFGLLILFRPIPEGITAIAWVVGFYALITGVLYFMLALRVRKY